MTQISVLEKGTPRLQVLKDTTESWLYTWKPSPYSGMIKRAYINDEGQRHARHKLNLDEEIDDSKITSAHILRALTRVKHTNMDEDTSSKTQMDVHTLRALIRVKYTNMDEDTITLILW